MATEQDLMAAVLAHPDEDTPRLAYADWLDEHAGELPGRDPQEVRDRAAVIRFQIAQENDPPEPASWDESQERRRLERLSYDRPAWMPPLPSWANAVLYRGFAEGVRCDAAEFAAHAPELFAVAPIRRLTVEGWPVTAAGLAALGACPHIGRIRHLDFLGNYEGADLVALCRSPHLRDMITLDASPNDLSDEPAVALAACRGLDGLRGLRLVGDGSEEFGPVGVKAVADSPHFDRLRTLILRTGGIGGDAAQALAGGPILRSLTTLVLDDCGIGDAGVVALTASPDLGALTRLSLDRNQFGAAGAAALAGCERLRSVHRLDLWSCHIGDDGAARLAASDVFAGVRDLGLGVNNLGPDGVRALFAGGAFRRLWELRLYDNEGLGDGGAAAVAAAPLDEVRRLWLVRCGIGKAGAVALANSPRLRNLHELDLGSNRIGNGGAVALANSPWLRNLHELDLQDNQIGPVAARALANSPHLTRLKQLDLDDNPIDDDTRRKLKARFGDIDPG